MKFFYYIKRLISIPTIEKRLLFMAFFLSIIAKFMVQLLPLKYYLFLLNAKPKFLISESKKSLAIRLSRKTMQRIDRFGIFKLSCLMKSVIFKILLGNLGVESYVALGVNNSHPRLLRAHAFVKVDNKVVYQGNKNFTEVYSVE